MKIACWSGPRNISTALMRSWSSREDTFVSDEPFYAYYLKNKELKHPMWEEIINYYPNTYHKVVKNISTKIPKSKEIWYQKHMAHHLIDLKEIEWIENFHNCFLIRNPKDVINSYIKKNELNSIDELGYPQQYELIKYLNKRETNIIVIDADRLLENPKKILHQWCKHLNIKFNKKMLRWKKGLYDTDGIWAKYWYDNVIKTEKFEKKNQKKINLNVPKKYQPIYSEAIEYYKIFSKLSLK